MFTVAALYQFASLNDYPQIKPALDQLCRQHAIKGTLLIACEGINGTVAGSRSAIDTLLAHLRSDDRLAQLSCKFSTTENMPFKRMKVRLKKEIVTLGVANVDPTRQVGQYVEPVDWNELASDPQVTLLDTRNDYEVAIGTFAKAQNPHTESFRQFPDYVKTNLNPHQHSRIAMFCTGGIRCEKASAYMLNQGFEHVYHLKGGILKYLEQIPESQSLWRGECYVFDDRVSVTHGLTQGKYALCHGCGNPITKQDKQADTYQPGVSCPACFNQTTPDKKKRWSERQRQINLTKFRGK